MGGGTEGRRGGEAEVFAGFRSRTRHSDAIAGHPNVYNSMMMAYEKFDAWKAAHELVLAVYRPSASPSLRLTFHECSRSRTLKRGSASSIG